MSGENLDTLTVILDQLFNGRRVDPGLLATDAEWVNPPEAVGMEVESPHGQIWSFRDGLVTRMEWFNTHREALQAGGITE